MRRPDFTIPIETADGPDVKDWEHWGVAGDPGYDASMKRRLAWYEKHGLVGKLIHSDERVGSTALKSTRLFVSICCREVEGRYPCAIGSRLRGSTMASEHVDRLEHWYNERVRPFLAEYFSEDRALQAR